MRKIKKFVSSFIKEVTVSVDKQDLIYKTPYDMTSASIAYLQQPAGQGYTTLNRVKTIHIINNVRNSFVSH
jgi:hypothetical protein